MILECRDCIEFLQSIPDDYVDMVLVDPPYDGVLGVDWDNQWSSKEEYIEWCRRWVAECVRVLRPERCLCVWGTTKTNQFLRFKLDVLDCVDELQYINWIIWSYDWGGRTRKTFPRKHEDLLVYANGDEWLFNADDVRVPYKMAKNVRATAANHPLGKVPTDVWEKNNHTGSKEYCDWHPTQKPVVLLSRLIRAFTNPGDVVLDCFAGSGSTAISCIETGREFVGCEASQRYFELSQKRIDDWHPTTASA